METIQTLVRNLAIILLIATFLEFLLPNKSMRNFVQLVMGIFVISAILNPISQLLNFTLEMDIPAWTSLQEKDVPALAQDDEGVKIGNNAVQEQYRKILTNQIQALTLAIKMVQHATVKIDFEEDNQSSQPVISKVHITITTSSHDIKIDEIIPVIIGEDGSTIDNQDSKTEKVTEKAKEVKEKIVELMGLSPNTVEVVEI